MANLLSDQTLRRLHELIRRDGGGGGLPAQATGRVRGRTSVLVRCTSAAAAAADSSGSSTDDAFDECYPGVIVDPGIGESPQPELGAVWLTVLGDDGQPVVPIAGAVYLCLLAGELDVAGDRRLRAFGTPSFGDPCNPRRCATHTSVSVIHGCGVEEPGSGSEPPRTCCQEYWVNCTGHFDDGSTLGEYCRGANGCGDLDFCGDGQWSAVYSYGAGKQFTVPSKRCVTLTGGTGSFADLVATTSEVIFSQDSLGWGIEYADADAGITISGRLKFCPTREAFFFVGSVRSKASNPAKPGEQPCGCSTTWFSECPDEETQELIDAPDLANGDFDQTIRLHTPCGTIDITLNGCPAPPGQKYYCVPVGGGCTATEFKTCQAYDEATPPAVFCSGPHDTLAECQAACVTEEPPPGSCPEFAGLPGTLVVPDGDFAGTYNGTWNGDGTEIVFDAVTVRRVFLNPITGTYTLEWMDTSAGPDFFSGADSVDCAAGTIVFPPVHLGETGDWVLTT